MSDPPLGRPAAISLAVPDLRWKPNETHKGCASCEDESSYPDRHRHRSAAMALLTHSPVRACYVSGLSNKCWCYYVPQSGQRAGVKLHSMYPLPFLLESDM